MDIDENSQGKFILYIVQCSSYAALSVTVTLHFVYHRECFQLRMYKSSWQTNV